MVTPNTVRLAVGLLTALGYVPAVPYQGELRQPVTLVGLELPGEAVAVWELANSDRPRTAHYSCWPLTWCFQHSERFSRPTPLSGRKQ